MFVNKGCENKLKRLCQLCISIFKINNNNNNINKNTNLYTQGIQLYITIFDIIVHTYYAKK